MIDNTNATAGPISKSDATMVIDGTIGGIIDRTIDGTVNGTVGLPQREPCMAPLPADSHSLG